MKKAFEYLIIILLLASCSSDKKSVFDEMPPLYSDPQEVAVNMDGGYILNPVTRDSIQPLINSLGDTILTGVPIPVKGKIIHPDSVGQALIIPADKPQTVPLRSNVYNIPKDLSIIPVDKDKLRTFTLRVDTLSHVLVHSSGDTIPTGIPVQVKGKIVPCAQPRPIKALLPDMNDNASRNIKYLGKDQGLNSNYISKIFEDSHGNLWFGTIGGGVCRYNGNSFMHFTEEEGLSKNVVRSIHEDLHGNLWFGTDGGGISMYDGETFTHYTEKEGLINNTVYAIAEDSNGNLWFGTRGGVSKFNGSTFTHFTEEEGLSWNTVRSIIVDKHGNLWFGTEHGGISVYNGETFTYFTENEGLISNTIYSIAEDSNGNLWFATGRGINMYDGQVIRDFSIITESEKLNYNTVISTMEDSNGNLWFGSYGGGVSMYNGETYTHFTENEGLSNNYVTSILEDSNGNLWFGTNGGGVNLYNVNSFTPYADIEDLSNNTGTSILEDSQGNLWFGTDDNGVFIHDGKTYKHITEKEGLRFNGVYTIMEDSHNNIWFSYRWGRGVCMFDGKTFTQFTGVGLYNNHVLSILEDDHRNLWFTKTGHGITKYDGEIFTDFTEKEGLSQNTITSVIQDSKGNLWLGTYERGVSKYDGNYITHYTEKEGLVNNFVLSVFEDSHGNIWIGTEGGLSIYNGETFTQYTEKEGLSNSAVQSILEDNNNNIWIGTKHGLNYFSYKRDNVFSSTASLSRSVRGEVSEKVPYNYPIIYTYNTADGLSGIEFYQHSAALDKKNRIWWGSNKGFTVLDMNEFQAPVEPPAIQLNQIDINEYVVDYHHLKDNNEMGLKFNGVAKFNNYPLNLELPFKRNHLTFHFSAIDWAAPDKIRYSFKMEGLNDNWSQLTEEHKADYRNMPHGTYTFLVRAVGKAQKWSAPFEYTFSISPPWWRTWWAIVFACVFATSLLIMIIRFRERNLKQRAVLLEQKVDQKTREVLEQRMEVDELKSRFFTNISHEFRTPLTLIMGPLRDLEKQKGDSLSISRKTVSTLGRNARRLLLLINQLLDISKMEKKAMKLNLEIGDLSQKLQILVSSFQSLAESQNIEYIIDIASCPVKACYDADKVEKVVINLLSNAFKFTPNDGKVVLQLSYRIDEVHKDQYNAVLEVTDNGRGIEKQDLEKIFDRFYQVVDKENSDKQGTGIGLALTNELIHLMHGEIDVESIPGERTTFSVTFPVTKDCFSDEEANFTRDEDEIDEEDDPIIEEESEIMKSDDPIPKGELILVVEDNAELRGYISDLFKPDYQVLEAENGKAGFESAIEHIPDLVITDLMMPEMGGMELCKNLKDHPVSNHIPVIMLTAKADKESKMEGLEAAADDYFIKPFDSEELIVRAKNLMRVRSDLRKSFEQKFIMDNSGGEPNSPQFLLLRKFTKVFISHMDDPDFSVEDLADEFNMSRSQLFRKIKAVFGTSPTELMRLARFKRAASLLRSGNLNVTQVMYQVGMQSPSYFAKTFKKYYGVNPGEYQNRT